MFIRLGMGDVSPAHLAPIPAGYRETHRCLDTRRGPTDDKHSRSENGEARVVASLHNTGFGWALPGRDPGS